MSINSSNFIHILQHRATHQPQKLAYAFLLDDKTKTINLSYQELYLQTISIASLLQELKSHGERALLLYPPGLDFIAAFFGCLFAGTIAVPLYPPRNNQKLTQLKAIVQDTGAKFVLTNTFALNSIKKTFSAEPELAALHCINTEAIGNQTEIIWQEPELFDNTLAFLQYTSGSTGIPKGVMVSHENLLYNQQMIQTGFQHTQETIFVGWLPLFHDMGLIGNILQPLYLGIPSYLLSPMAFLKNPYLWLKTISEYKATTSGGPNFAYSLCVQKIRPEQRASLDLSNWQVAFNGAEPIYPEVLKQFTATFASCGFDHTAFYPCYGMAEATLFISGGVKTAAPITMRVSKSELEQNRVVEIIDNQQKSQEILGCGRAWLDEKVIIVDPNSLTQCSPKQVGEVWVAGKHIAQGYWYRPDLTKAIFQAYLSDTGEGPFLRTGDLGFIVDGELFIAGRLKDLIIIRGRNYYPQDIELTVEQTHPALRPTCGAAFSVEVDGEEQLVILQEVERSHRHDLNVEMIVKNIRQQIAEHHNIQPYAIVLLKFATIPKTSSGKIQRYICRTKFLSSSLDVIGQWIKTAPGISAESPLTIESAPTKELIQTWFIHRLASYINIPPDEIEIAEPLTSYGLDSSVAVTLTEELAKWLKIELSPVIFWKYVDIDTLSTHLIQEYQNSHPSLLA